MIGDGMSDMGGSLPEQDDLDVNVQPIIDAIEQMSINRSDWGPTYAEAIEYLNSQAAGVMTIPAVMIDLRGEHGPELADRPVSVVVDMNEARARRGTTNRNDRGNAKDRERRRAWLVETYRADADAYPEPWTVTSVVRSEPACRCYRCGTLLTVDTVTVDRIIPGCKGGTYRRNNIRPACSSCNSITGSTTRR